ncbi:MAG TPA: hypothetical protein VE868_03415 [Balneolaceae bacterium]|nr:hypothetical protein [Balneolaceae bacterium]
MHWGVYLLAAAGVFASCISFYLYKKINKFKILAIFIASLLFILIVAGMIVSPIIGEGMGAVIISQITRWAQIFSIAFVLSSLLLFLKNMKPVYGQFTGSYIVFPFIIVLSYGLVYNSTVLQNFLINIYEAAITIVGLLIFISYSYNEHRYFIIFAGTVFFLLSFIINMLLPSYAILEHVLLAVGIVTVLSGFLLVNDYLQQTAGETL